MALIAVLLMLQIGCSSEQITPDNHEGLNATLWTQTAAEYAANTLQAYRVAASNLDRALADPQWSAALEQTGDYSSLPPAVMLDLDQTVLDTSTYNARIIRKFGQHSREQFAQWCRQSTATAIPGAKEFIDYAIAQGVAVIYISARRETLRDCTAVSLRALGLPLPEPGQLLLSGTFGVTDKGQHRTRTATHYRILLLLGDNLDDFVSGSHSDPATRQALMRRHAGRWGRQWIILPNPMYGSWESSLYDYDYKLPRNEKLLRKLQSLQQ